KSAGNAPPTLHLLALFSATTQKLRQNRALLHQMDRTHKQLACLLRRGYSSLRPGSSLGWPSGFLLAQTPHQCALTNALWPQTQRAATTLYAGKGVVLKPQHLQAC